MDINEYLSTIPENSFYTAVYGIFKMNLTIMSEDDIITLINTLRKINISEIKDEKKNIFKKILTELSEKPLPDNMNNVMNDGMINDGMFNMQSPSDNYKKLFDDLKSTVKNLLNTDTFRNLPKGGKSHHRKKRKSRSRSKSRKRSKSRGKSKRK